MSGKIIISDNKKINKNNLYKNKKLFNIYCIDVGKLLNTFLDIIMMSLDLYE